tara:strand:- start:577 stop:888 length:312 start_codon:yes stop_codon:yes gene_type:complete
MLATGVSMWSLPRSISIIAATEPIALVMENIRKAVSRLAAEPGAASPDTPDQVIPAALPVIATINGTSSDETELSIICCMSGISSFLKNARTAKRLQRTKQKF